MVSCGQWHHSTMVEARDQLSIVGWGAEWQRDGGHALSVSDVAAILASTKKVAVRFPAAK